MGDLEAKVGEYQGKYEEYQQKYSVTFQEKAAIHEQYFAEKQNSIELIKKYNDLQNQLEKEEISLQNANKVTSIIARETNEKVAGLSEITQQ